MGGGIGALLNFYVFPLLGCSLLALGAWASWAIWRPRADARAPSLAVRVGGVILGCVWGWFMTNLQYARDAAHVTVGFPMPVMTLVRSPQHWIEWDAAASIPCVLLNLAIGIGLVNALLRALWKGRAPR